MGLAGVVIGDGDLSTCGACAELGGKGKASALVLSIFNGSA
jgi:hypothetical protein